MCTRIRNHLTLKNLMYRHGNKPLLLPERLWEWNCRQCVNTDEEMLLHQPAVVSRGPCWYKLFKRMVACDLWGQVAGHQLSPFSICVHVCVCMRAFTPVWVFVHASGAFARSSGFCMGFFFWPTYCSRRSTQKKSVLIGCLFGQPSRVTKQISRPH